MIETKQRQAATREDGMGWGTRAFVNVEPGPRGKTYATHLLKHVDEDRDFVVPLPQSVLKGQKLSQSAVFCTRRSASHGRKENI